jgi:hypothetical protein
MRVPTQEFSLRPWEPLRPQRIPGLTSEQFADLCILVRDELGGGTAAAAGHQARRPTSVGTWEPSRVSAVYLRLRKMTAAQEVLVCATGAGGCGRSWRSGGSLARAGDAALPPIAPATFDALVGDTRPPCGRRRSMKGSASPLPLLHAPGTRPRRGRRRANTTSEGPSAAVTARACVTRVDQRGFGDNDQRTG